MLVRFVVGFTLVQGQQHRQPPMNSPYPTGKCTHGSFPLPGAKHHPTDSFHPTGECTPGSFSLPAVKHKTPAYGQMNPPNRIVTLLWVPPPLGVNAFNLSRGRTPTSGPYQVHSSADGAKPSLGSNREPNSTIGIAPTRRPNFAAGIIPTRRSGSSLCYGSYPRSE